MTTFRDLKVINRYFLACILLLAMSQIDNLWAQDEEFNSFFIIDGPPQYEKIIEFLKRKEESGEIFWASDQGITLLEWAVRLQQVELVKTLLEQDALPQVNRSAQQVLEEAVYAGSVETVRLLMSRIAEFGAQSKLDSERLLYLALTAGNVDMADYLVMEFGVSISEVVEKNDDILPVLIGAFDLSVVRYVFDHGVDINYAGSEGHNLLHIAIGSGRLDIVGLLIGLGADVNARAEFGMSPLGSAITSAELGEEKLLPALAIMNLLLESGADACEKSQTVALLVDGRFKYLTLKEYLAMSEQAEILSFFEGIECPAVDE